MSRIEELPIPDAVINTNKKAELARIWVADGRQIVTISSRLWDDPGAWGLMLVDLAHHVANAYETAGYDREKSIERIKTAFEVEWNNSTGEIVKL